MKKDVRQKSLWTTLLQALLLGLVAGLGGYLLITAMLHGQTLAHTPQGQDPAFQGPPPPFPGGPGGRGGRGGFGGEERKLIARFDKNKDKRLDSAERAAARETLATEGSSPRGFGGRRGFPGGRGLNPGTPGPRVTPADVKSYPNASLYDPSVVRTILLQFENNDWEQELAAFYNSDVDVPAIATVDGKVYKNVGVHFRGASSYMMVPEGSKRSLNLAFDFVDGNQTIGKYKTMNLLNANGDPTFVRAMIYSDIAQQYIPTPRTNYVKVAINGEYWGVYVSAQQFNKDFTRDFFGTTEGARWKVPGNPGGRGGMEYLGEDPAAYKRTYEIKSKDDPKSWASLIRMFKVLNETPPEKLEAALSPLLDIDGTLKFLAIENALVNSDGYWARASDYSIYQDPKGRFHVIPHDLNEGLADEGGGRGFPMPPPGVGPPGGPRGFGGPGGPGRGRGMFGRATVELDPLIGLDDASKPLRSKLLAVPALRERYLGYVRDIATKWLDWNTLGPRVKKYQALIAADVKADTRRLYGFEAFETDIDGHEHSLKSFVERRRAFLLK
jgi:spore coat protein CotH